MDDLLSGIVEKFLFKNDETGFFVFLVRISANEIVTVKGFVHALQLGQCVDLTGTWNIHPKFGKQFDMATCSVQVPTSINGLKKYLGSGMIKGIGKVYAEKLVDYFGIDILDIIENDPYKLKEVAGIGTKRIETIIVEWDKQKHVAKIMSFLHDKGVSSAYAAKIYKQYGTESIALVTENPYRIAHDIWGIGFKMADQIAQKIGFSEYSQQRINAGILFAITIETGFGHVYVELDNLKQATIALLELDVIRAESVIKNALHVLYNTDKIKLISWQEQHFITTSVMYYTEKNIAKRILELMNFQVEHAFDLTVIYNKLRMIVTPIELNDAQQSGIMNCLQQKVSIITGGPGTGKTTLVKTFLSILDDYKLTYKLAAPTGRAAKRLQEGTGKYAETLHRLLAFNPSSRDFTYNDLNALKLDFLIIDEASMIDMFLMNAILRALPLSAHVIFLGDIDQLPSVGAGNVLNDLIASKIIFTTRLNYIFRQSHNSLISYNAHKINKGEMPVYQMTDANNDFQFIREENPDLLPVHLKKIFLMSLQKYSIHKSRTIVLSPMNRGSAGTQKLNIDIQSILNPFTAGSNEFQRMGSVYRVDDRVMQIKNNYDKHVFNGDIGIIKLIDFDDKLMNVDFDGHSVNYDFLELDEIVHAYAISIHKSQGSEFDAVIIPIFMQHFTLLQRNLIYTALTRAKKYCIIIGQMKALAMAIKNNKSVLRLTFLQQFLTSSISCR